MSAQCGQDILDDGLVLYLNAQSQLNSFPKLRNLTNKTTSKQTQDGFKSYNWGGFKCIAADKGYTTPNFTIPEFDSKAFGFTVSFWFCGNPSDTNPWMGVTNKFYNYEYETGLYTPRGWYVQRYNGGNRLSIRFDTDQNNFNVHHSMSGTQIDGKWHHICFVISDSGQLYIYQNGILNAKWDDATEISKNASGLASPNAQLKIPLDDTLVPFYLNNIALYSKALTAEEVKRNYNNSVGLFKIKRITSSLQNLVSSGLVLALDPADLTSYSGTGTSWYDISGNANNFTVTSGIIYDAQYGGRFFSTKSPNTGASSVKTWPNMGLGNTFTIQMLINNNVLDGANGAMLATGNYQSNGFRFRITSTGSVQLQCGEQGGTINITSSAGLIIKDKTYLVTISYNGTSASLYIDGILVSSNTGTLVASTTTVSVNSSTNGNKNNVSFYKIYAYNRALTLAEVQQNYNELKSRYNLE